MISYQVEFHPSAKREMEDLPLPIFEQAHHEIENLSTNPRPMGAIKLKDNLYRIRVRDWRIIYAIFDHEKIITIVRITRRSEKTYRGL